MVVEDCYDIRMFPWIFQLFTQPPGFDGPGCLQLAMLVHDARKLRMVSDLKRLTKRDEIQSKFPGEFDDIFASADTARGSTALQKFTHLLHQRQDVCLCWLPALVGPFEKPRAPREVKSVWRALHREAAAGPQGLVDAIATLELMYFRNSPSTDPRARRQMELLKLSGRPARECLLYLYFAVSILNRRDLIQWDDTMNILSREEAEVIMASHVPLETQKMPFEIKIPWWVADMHTRAGRQRQRRIYGANAEHMGKVEFRDVGCFVVDEDTTFKNDRFRALYNRTFEEAGVPSSTITKQAICTPASDEFLKCSSSQNASPRLHKSSKRRSRVQGTWGDLSKYQTASSRQSTTHVKQGRSTTCSLAEFPEMSLRSSTSASPPTACSVALAKSEDQHDRIPSLPLIHWKSVTVCKHGALGKGVSGNVFRVRFKGDLRCVKVLKTRGASATRLDRLTKEYEQECTAFARLGHHPALLHAFGRGIDDNNNPFIMMELAPHGSLHDVLLKPDTPLLDNTLITDVGSQILHGLSHLHDRGYIFMDLHLGNVLVRQIAPKKLSVCIADFGGALHQSEPTTTWHGHRRLSPWEVLEQCYELKSVSDVKASPRKMRRKIHANQSIDIFMFGRLLFELISPRTHRSIQSGRPNVWPELDDMTLIARVLKRQVPCLSAPCFDNFRNIIQLCWRDDPAERPSASILLQLMPNSTATPDESELALSRR